MSPIPWDCSIPLDRRIMTVCVLSHTPKPTFSSSASASPPLHHSKTFARSGSLRFTTTALAFPASLLELRSI